MKGKFFTELIKPTPALIKRFGDTNVLTRDLFAVADLVISH